MTSELTDFLITVDWHMDTWCVCFRRKASVQGVDDSDKKRLNKKKKNLFVDSTGIIFHATKFEQKHIHKSVHKNILS